MRTLLALLVILLADASPKPPPEFMGACYDLIRQGRHDEARELLEPIAADHPEWSRAQFFLGLTYHRQQRYVPARQLFERALELDPASHEIRVFLGWSLYYVGELAAAREVFESYLGVRPDYADAIFALGLIDYDEDRIESARARFEKVIALAQARPNPPVEAKARARLADCLVRTDHLPEARDQLTRSIELNPNNYEAYFKLSRVLQRLGDETGAEQARQMHQQVRARIRHE